MSNLENEKKINSLCTEINILCLTLGERYYDLNKDCPDDNLASLIIDITDKKAELEQLREEMTATDAEAVIAMDAESVAVSSDAEVKQEEVQEIVKREIHEITEHEIQIAEPSDVTVDVSEEVISPVQAVEPVAIPEEKVGPVITPVVTNLRFCVNCGNQLDVEDVFCTQCGFKQPQEEVPVQAGNPTPVAIEEPVVAPVPVKVTENAADFEPKREYDSEATVLLEDVTEYMNKQTDEEEMVFCGFCRARIPADSVYCVECGAKQL